MGEFLLRSVFCVLMIALASSSAHCGPFSDVPWTHWTFDELRKINDKINLEDDLSIVTTEYHKKYHVCSPITRYEMAILVAHVFEKLPSCKPGKTSFECKYKIRLQRKNFTISNEEIDDLMKSIKKLVVEFKDELTALGVEPFYKFPIKKQSFLLNTSKFFLFNLKIETRH